VTSHWVSGQNDKHARKVLNREAKCHQVDAHPLDWQSFATFRAAPVVKVKSMAVAEDFPGGSDKDPVDD